ncbi:MAG: DUF2284 domain-containing protein [Eubacteriales bacterium]|nr:DUF2284 domain-containing protein [Eubacteriales bacterium]
MNRDEVIRRMKELGLTACVFLDDADAIRVYPEFRVLCEKNTCRAYDTNWAGPPACGTIEECEARIRQYKRSIFLQYVHTLIDSYDFEGMAESARLFRDMMSAAKSAFRELYDGDFLILGAGCCRYCEKCTYPDAPCRHPDKAISSVESYGLNVTDLTKMAGADYAWSSGKMYNVGMIFYDRR